MKHKFKKGDRVKRISYSDSPDRFGEMGKIYTISRVGSVELFFEEIPNYIGGASPKAFILAPNLLPDELFEL